MSGQGRGFRPEGLIGLIGVGLMVGACYHLDWQVPWAYVVIATVAYLIATVVTSVEGEVKAAWSAHLAYGLLSAGLLIRLDGFWNNTALFVVAASLGVAIPFIVHHDK